MKKVILLITAITAITASSMAEVPPVVIDVTTAAPEGAHVLTAGRKYWLGEFTSGVNDGAAIGYTRTSRKVNSPIVCNPDVGSAVRQSLAAALAAQGALAGSEGEAGFVITARVPFLKIEEKSKTFHQTVSASIRIEVEVTGVDSAARGRKLSLESGGERTAYDATKHAQEAAREAVRAAVGEILKNIDSLQ